MSDGVGAAVGEGAALGDAVGAAAGVALAAAESGYLQDVDAAAEGVGAADATGASLMAGVGTAGGAATAAAAGDALQPSFAGVATSAGTVSAVAEGQFNQWGVGSAEAFALVSGLSLSGITAIGMAAARAEAAAVGQNGTVTLSGGDLDTICDRVWTRLIERGFTAEQLHRLIAAVLAGRVHGAGTGMEHFRSVADDKERLTVVVDRSGNRTAVVTDVE